MAETDSKPLEPLFPTANEGSTEFAIDKQFEKLDKKIGGNPTTPTTRAVEDPEDFNTRVHEAVDEYLNGDASPLGAIVTDRLKNLSDADVAALKKALGIGK